MGVVVVLVVDERVVADRIVQRWLKRTDHRRMSKNLSTRSHDDFKFGLGLEFREISYRALRIVSKQYICGLTEQLEQQPSQQWVMPIDEVGFQIGSD